MFKKFVTIIFILTGADSYGQKTLRMTVSNSGDARERSIVKFPYHVNANKKTLQLVDQKTKATYPVQILPSGEAFSILDIGANESRGFDLKSGSGKTSTVNIKPGRTELQILVHGRQVIGIQNGEANLPEGVDTVFRRGGYVHPVLSPGGLKITDDYPSDHRHHHGIWSAWTKTQFRERNPDFWNVGGNTGAVYFKGFDKIATGPVLAAITVKNGFVDKTAIPYTEVLDEDFSVKVFNIVGGDKPYYLFDVELRQKCATEDPLKLLNHIYGGIAFRGNEKWNGKENANFLTSGGKSREAGNATTADWVRISGLVDDKITGVTILSHPENFRAPQPLRIHPKEPYISFAPSQAGEFSIKPGKEYVARYRFIVYDGAPDTEFIERMWYDYSNPLEVKITEIYENK